MSAPGQAAASRSDGSVRADCNLRQARGAVRAIANAIDTHVQAEQDKDDDEDGPSRALVPTG